MFDSDTLICSDIGKKFLSLRLRRCYQCHTDYSSSCPRKKTSLGENLARSHAYNQIWDSRRDFLARKFSPTVSPKVSPRVSTRLPARLLAMLSARLLARLFAPKSLTKSLGSDYMHDSWRDSLRDSFFYEGVILRQSSTKRSFLITPLLETNHVSPKGSLRVSQ